MNTVATPAAQLRGFLLKYQPKTATQARRALTKMRALVPGATEMVYDNYNALVVGFGPSERASEAVVSLAIFPKWVTLCFLQNGPRIRIGSAERIGECRPSCAARFGGGSRQARDQALIREVLRMAEVPIKRSAKGGW